MHKNSVLEQSDISHIRSLKKRKNKEKVVISWAIKDMYVYIGASAGNMLQKSHHFSSSG